jgi:hypothetical protein
MAWLQSFTVVDYVILGILLTALGIGWARGLVELLTGFVVFVVSTTVAGRYADDVVTWLNRLWGVRERLAGVIERRLNLPPEAYKVNAGAIPWERVLEWLRDLPLPDEYKMALAHWVADWSQTAGNKTVGEYVVQQFAGGVLHTLVFMVMVFVLGWLLALAGKLVSDQTKELPLVGTTNRLLGASVTVTETAVMLAVVIGMIVPMLSIYGMGQFGTVIGGAQLTPHFLDLFRWLRGTLFGLAGGYFFGI